MKFARQFDEALRKQEYPQDWIDSAISYRKLKKCIRKVREELQSLGLDRETLRHLWQQVPKGDQNHPPENAPVPVLGSSVHYDLEEASAINFTPKLTIAIDPRDGSPMDAWLSSETRHYLQDLAERQQANRKPPVITLASTSEDQQDQDNTTEGRVAGRRGQAAPEHLAPKTTTADLVTEEVETIEIPLTSDSEFFQILGRELNNLEHLQKTEQDRLNNQIVKLGHDLSALRATKSKKSKAQVDVWREIFRMYIESQVFFSSNEQDAGARDVEHIQKQLQLFTNVLVAEQATQLKLDEDAKAALETFMKINFSLLQFLRYQDINRVALTKILKKFDKQTALHAGTNVMQSLQKAPFMAQDLARATCYTISKELLEQIPQLDDYLCPVCFTIAYKPIRLRCGHVFCIRCMIVMQRAEKDHCPLCRGTVVMEATSGTSSSDSAFD